jgi:hypothetical protein
MIRLTPQQITVDAAAADGVQRRTISGVAVSTVSPRQFQTVRQVQIHARARYRRLVVNRVIHATRLGADHRSSH